MTLVYLHPRRTFNPEVTARYGRPTFPMKQLVKYSPKYGWARVFNFPYRGSHWRPRMHTVVVSVDGPCKINNAADPRSRAAFAVYFDMHDPKNVYGLVESQFPQTNSRAELEGLRQALIAIQTLKLSGQFDTFVNPFKEVIIRLTSQYVVDAFHRDVWQWEMNGWKKSDGGLVAHVQLVQEIHSMMCDMEQNMRIAVRLWRTERDPEAEKLANRVFDDQGNGYTDDEE